MSNEFDLHGLIARLRTWARGKEEISSLFIYGSHSQGNANERSDVDVAIKILSPNDESGGLATFLTQRRQWESELRSICPVEIQLEYIDETNLDDIPRRGVHESSILVYQKDA